MKRYGIILLMAVLVTIAACTQTGQITSFEECVAAGNPVMESYPRQCQADGQTFVEQEMIGGQTDEHGCMISAGYSWNEEEQACVREWLQGEERYQDKFFCTEEQKAAEMCTMEYMPVCGDNGVTYGNKCVACSSGEIDYYILGDCPESLKPSAAGITIAELGQHNSESDCWIVYENNVYDVTDYLSQHPGGSAAISEHCGTTNFENAFLRKHGLSKVETMIRETIFVGELI